MAAYRRARNLLAVPDNVPDANGSTGTPMAPPQRQRFHRNANGFTATPMASPERQRFPRNANGHTHSPPKPIDAPEISGASMVIVGEFRSTLALRSLRWRCGLFVGVPVFCVGVRHLTRRTASLGHGAVAAKKLSSGREVRAAPIDVFLSSGLEGRTAVYRRAREMATD